MPKKKRYLLNKPKKSQRRRKIANAVAKRKFEQESSNFSNEGTGPPCSMFNEDLHKKKLGLSVYQNVKPFILNRCNGIESSNTVKIEQTDEVSVESTVLYQPKYIDYRNVFDEQYTYGSGSSCSQEDPARLSVYQNVKTFIHDKCDVIESSNSIQSDVCNSVKIEQTDEVSVENTVLYQPKYIVDRNYIYEQYTYGSGSSCSQEDPARFLKNQDFKPHIATDYGVLKSDISNRSSALRSVKTEESDEKSVENFVVYQPRDADVGSFIQQRPADESGKILFVEDDTSSCYVEKDESTMSSNEKEKCVPTLMHSTMEKELLHNKSADFNEVLNESSPKLILLHVDKVDRERKDQCQSCRYVSCSETILKMHIESICSYSKHYKCHLCGFVCDSKSKLKDHIGEVHLKLHKFDCSLKNSSFEAEKSYKPVLSNGKLKFVCNDCNYKTILKAHMLLHLKSRPHAMKTFKCIYCDFSSTQYWSWKNHMDCVHFELNNYKCHLCDYDFRLKQNLERHIDAVHFQKRPYKCGYCNYRALQKGTVQRHIKNVHLLQKNYHCNYCSYSAANNNTLQSHIKSYH